MSIKTYTLTYIWKKATWQLVKSIAWIHNLSDSSSKMKINVKNLQKPVIGQKPTYKLSAWTELTLYLLMATIVAIWPNWVFCRIGKFNTCTLTTLILKNLHHWFVFIFDFRTYQVFSWPCISQCIVFNWKALMLISPHHRVGRLLYVGMAQTCHM